MSRSAVLNALTSNAALNLIGIDSTSVFHNYSLEERPIKTGPFIILRWESEDRAPFGDVKSPMRLTLWAHWPLEETNDYNRLEKLLDACDIALKSVEDVAGTDGYTVTCIRSMGRSGDFKDDGFQTISKNAGYEVLSRRS